MAPGGVVFFDRTLIGRPSAPVNVSGQYPTIVGQSYNFSQLEYYISMEGKDDFWDRIWPWIASDGTDYLYLLGGAPGNRISTAEDF